MQGVWRQFPVGVGIPCPSVGFACEQPTVIRAQVVDVMQQALDDRCVGKQPKEGVAVVDAVQRSGVDRCFARHLHEVER